MDATHRQQAPSSVKSVSHATPARQVNHNNRDTHTTLDFIGDCERAEWDGFGKTGVLRWQTETQRNAARSESRAIGGRSEETCVVKLGILANPVTQFLIETP